MLIEMVQQLFILVRRQLGALTESEDTETQSRNKIYGHNNDTPLLMACSNGHYSLVEYFINKCHIDIEETGSIVFRGETIEGVSPLWCAATAGQLKIVKLLILKGAHVNSTTETNSTPLRMACYNGRLDIVKYLVCNGADIELANRCGHTCLMIACHKGHIHIVKYLLSLNVNVNRISKNASTALHDCAESGNLEILKLLIENGATMTGNSDGLTPLLTAAVNGRSHIVEYLITMVQRSERIDALVLLGAFLVDEKHDMIGALVYWKRAMEERCNGIGPPIIKQTAKTVAAYDHAVEITDPEGLDDLMADPDQMRMQALVMRERILGPAHPTTSYYIVIRGAAYVNAGNFKRCIELWNYALDMEQSLFERVNKPMAESSLFSFTELFWYMMRKEGKPTVMGRIVPPLDFENLMKVFHKAVKEVEMAKQMLERMPNVERDVIYLNRVNVMALQLASLLIRFLDNPRSTEEMSERVHSAIYTLVKLRVRSKRGRTALHLACYIEPSPVGEYPKCKFPSPHLVEELLRLGADPNARDEEGNTPLHLAGMARPFSRKISQFLVEHGAHIDFVNNNGDTFTSLLETEQRVPELVNTAKYTRLSCLAARVIKQFKIPYKGHVTSSLEHFIENH